MLRALENLEIFSRTKLDIQVKKESLSHWKAEYSFEGLIWYTSELAGDVYDKYVYLLFLLHSIDP